MQLDLVDRRGLAGLLDHSAQVRGLEVRDADRADETLVAQLDEGLPGLHVAVVGGYRPVDQVEVDVLHLQTLEALVAGALGLLVAVVVVPALGREEDLAAVEPGWRGPPARPRLVAVGGGGVDVAVAGLEGTGDGLARSRPGGTWKTPNPSWGIDSPPRSASLGT